jgi:type IV pilus assembly protein PilQ
VTSAEAKIDERGSITVDERTNNIIAYQTQDRLDELRRIVAQLDIPVRQVMIEARIVEANVDYDKSLGVRWGGSIQNKGNWNTSGVSNGTSTTIGTPGSTSTNSPFVDMGAVEQHIRDRHRVYHRQRAGS